MSVRASGLNAVQRLKWLRQVAGTPELTEAALRVAIALADRQNADTGQLNPSIKRLAADAGLALRSVRYATRQLEDAGLLGVRRSRGGSSRNTSEYRLKLRTGMNHGAPLHGDAPVHGDAARGASHCSPGVHGDAPEQGIEQGRNREGENTRAQTDSTSRSPYSKNGKSRLREDWTLPDDWRQWARRETEKYGAALDVAMEAENFRDYWTGPDAKNPQKADWERTWRSWIRRSIVRRASSRKAIVYPAQGPLPTLDVDA